MISIINIRYPFRVTFVRDFQNFSKLQWKKKVTRKGHFDNFLNRTNLDSTRFHQSPLDSTRFHQSPLDSTRFHQSPPESTRFHQIPLDSTRFHQSPLDSTRVHQIPLDSTKVIFLIDPKIKTQTPTPNPLISLVMYINSKFQWDLNQKSIQNIGFFKFFSFLEIFTHFQILRAGERGTNNNAERGERDFQNQYRKLL